MDKRSLIEDLKASRADSRAEIGRIMAAAQRGKRDLSTGEATRFDALETDVKELDERIKELTDQVTADEAAANTARKFAFGSPIQRGAGNSDSNPWAAASARATSTGDTMDHRPAMPGKAYEPRATITRSEEVYRKYGEHSFFADLIKADMQHDVNAAQRLNRNNGIANDRAKAAGEIRAISTTNGQGGELVPPLWLENEFVRLARPGRVLVDLTNVEPLPGGTDVINVPKVNTGTAVAPQTTQNSAIQQTDITTTSVSSPVVTIAGGQTVSLQLLEQSPVSIDGLILADLAADYAVKLNTQVLAGTGTSGQVAGLLTLSGTQTIPYTQATPALAGTGGLYATLAFGIAKVHSARFAPPTAIVMSPLRWAWIVAQADTLGRPLVVPGASGPYNSMGVSTEVVAEGSAGTLLNLPVFLDATIPTNLGTGTNEDRILIIRRDDLFTWEGHVRAQSFQETYASNLSVFVRLYNYAAFIGNRYPQGTAIVSGVGLKTPAF
jgi:HK97 family phage major capsid protein